MRKSLTLPIVRCATKARSIALVLVALCVTALGWVSSAQAFGRKPQINPPPGTGPTNSVHVSKAPPAPPPKPPAPPPKPPKPPDPPPKPPATPPPPQPSPPPSAPAVLAAQPVPAPAPMPVAAAPIAPSPAAVPVAVAPAPAAPAPAPAPVPVAAPAPSVPATSSGLPMDPLPAPKPAPITNASATPVPAPSAATAPRAPVSVATAPAAATARSTNRHSNPSANLSALATTLGPQGVSEQGSANLPDAPQRSAGSAACSMISTHAHAQRAGTTVVDLTGDALIVSALPTEWVRAQLQQAGQNTANLAQPQQWCLSSKTVAAILQAPRPALAGMAKPMSFKTYKGVVRLVEQQAPKRKAAIGPRG